MYLLSYIALFYDIWKHVKNLSECRLSNFFLAEIAQFSWKIQLKKLLKQFLLKFFTMFQTSYEHAIWLKRCATVSTIFICKAWVPIVWKYVFNLTNVEHYQQFSWYYAIFQPKWLKWLNLTAYSRVFGFWVLLIHFFFLLRAYGSSWYTQNAFITPIRSPVNRWKTLSNYHFSTILAGKKG